MSKKGQDATSREGSPMTESKPTDPAKARPINFFFHSPWSARENPSQDLGSPVNQRTDDQGQGDLTRARKLVQFTRNPEVDRSQVKRRENAQSSDSWKQCKQEEASHSIGSRKLVQTASPRTDFQKMKFTINQPKRSWDLQKHAQRSQWQH